MEAATIYKEAASMFLKDNNESEASHLLNEAADLSIVSERVDWMSIIETYQKVAEIYSRNPILSAPLKKVAFRLALCHLAVGDHETA